MPPKQMTEKEVARQKGKIEYVFLVGVDLFSRYAFVKLWRVGKDIKKKDLMIVSEPPTETSELEGYNADKADDGVVDKVGAEKITETVKEWYKKINQMGFNQVRYFITDDGPEFRGKLEDFLKTQKSIHGITVPNDRVKNPVAERFIGTFKRLFGQYTALKGSNEITQEDVDKIVDFYNRRVHNSTNYSPDDVLNGISMKDGEIHIENTENPAPMLFNLYRSQKGESYYDMPKELLSDSIVRIYTKWSTDDKNVGDKKSNINNWSYTLYKIVRLNKADNHYVIEPISSIDPRDKKVKQPSERGLRRELLLPINIQDFKKYNLST